MSWSVASSSMYSGGSRSGRVDRICPSLANVGPSSSSAARKRLRLTLRVRPRLPRRAGRTAPSGRASRRRRRSSCRVRSGGARSRLGALVRSDAGSWRARGTVRRSASSAVFTMITVQRALWLIRFGTFPSRNSLRPGHAGVADDQHVDRVFLGRLDDRHGRVVVDHHVRAAALAGDLGRVRLELVGGAAGARSPPPRRTPCQWGCRARSPARCGGRPRSDRRTPRPSATARSAVSRAIGARPSRVGRAHRHVRRRSCSCAHHARCGGRVRAGARVCRPFPRSVPAPRWVDSAPPPE